jgi:hypothetical protein
VSWSRVVLAVVVGVECALIVFTLHALDEARLPFVTDLEQRPLARTGSVVVGRDDILDTVSIFYGSEAFDRDPLAERKGRVPSFRRALQFDPGHFSWVVLEDRVGPDLPLRRLGRKGVSGAALSQFDASLDDGVVNFFYDLGGNEGTFVHNWSTVGVQELQMSPLLTWTKRVDFIVLSAYDPQHCAALAYILRGNPDTLIFGPPLPPVGDPGSEEIVRLARSAPRLVQLAPGLDRLTDRLAIFVYPSEEGGERAALVIQTGSRRTVLAGARGMSMAALVGAIERAGGGAVTGFVGATGYEMDDERAQAELERLRKSHPDFQVAVGYGTPIEGLALIRGVLGPGRVHEALLGARIRLPSF